MIDIDIDLQQYISCAVQYEKQGLSTFIDYLAYLEDHEFYDSQVDRVTLMTIHASKGLEFDTICIVGFEEGMIPYFIPGTSFDVDEEKRLLYVAMTRAKRNVSLLFTETRNNKSQCVSRFKSLIDPFVVFQTDDAIEKVKKRNDAVKEKKSQMSLF